MMLLRALCATPFPILRDFGRAARALLRSCLIGSDSARDGKGDRCGLCPRALWPCPTTFRNGPCFRIHELVERLTGSLQAGVGHAEVYRGELPDRDCPTWPVP